MSRRRDRRRPPRPREGTAGGGDPRGPAGGEPPGPAQGGRPERGRGGGAERPPSGEWLRRPAGAGAFLRQAAVLAGVVVVVTFLADLAGAANLGVALGIAQIAFALALVALVLRA